jgi:hypothetical protein
MRTSDLLDRPVVDAAGRRIGRVRDVRLVRDGHDAYGRPVYRLDGLVVGRPFDGDRLGYGRTVDAPRLLAAVFAAVRRRQYYVHWGDVARIGPPIVLSTTVTPHR